MSVGSGKSSTLLAKFKLERIDFSGEDLDHGCFYYSKVCQGNLSGLPCTATQIEKALLQNTVFTDSEAGQDWMLKYCTLLSSLRHPHIVQFLGVSYKKDSPGSIAIITERMPARLASVLTSYGHLPEEISHSILRDVSLGLSYLHSCNPAIVHGEICAQNVFLTWDLTAKLSDIAMGSLLQLTSKQRKQIGSQTLAHVPPEVLLDQKLKSSKVDSYAFGALLVHVLGAEYPESLSLRAMCVDSHSKQANSSVGVLGGVSADHPLASLALQCLSNVPESRPSSAQILAILNEMMLQFPLPSLERRTEVLQRVFKTAHARKLSGSHERARATMERKDSIVSLSNTIEIEHLKLQIEELHVENRGLRTSIKKQKSIINARDHEMAAKLMAKDQEIISNQEEIAALEATVSASKATLSAKGATVLGLMNQLRNLQEYVATKHEPHLLSPQAKLKWKQAAHLPQAMVFAQAVCVGETVYFGSGTTTMSEGESQKCKIFSYDLSKDTWKPVQYCPVVGFAMSSFKDKLTLVGGAYESTNEHSKTPYALTGDVYTYDGESEVFDQCIPAMPTARLLATLLTYGSTLIACGGVVLDEKHDICVSTVEVYSSESNLWHHAEPLPLACTAMSHATIHERSYLLGGFTDTDFDHPTTAVFSVSLHRLVEDALTKTRTFGSSGAAAQDSPTPKIWERFPEAPRYAATVTSIGGCLVAIGGSDENLEHKSGALHVYSPLTNSWNRIHDIPVKCFSCAVTKLPKGELMIIGGMGHDEEDALRTVFRGCVRLD